LGALCKTIYARAENKKDGAKYRAVEFAAYVSIAPQPLRLIGGAIHSEAYAYRLYLNHISPSRRSQA